MSNKTNEAKATGAQPEQTSAKTERFVSVYSGGPRRADGFSGGGVQFQGRTVTDDRKTLLAHYRGELDFEVSASGELTIRFGEGYEARGVFATLQLPLPAEKKVA